MHTYKVHCVEDMDYNGSSTTLKIKSHLDASTLFQKMEDPFQSLLEDVTPRGVLRKQLDALKPEDTPAPIRRAVAGKRKSERIEKNALKRMKDGDDANLQTQVLGHQSQQSQQFSASDLGVSFNASSIRGVDRTYADLSALDSGESSINESIDLDLEAAARFRKKKRSVEYLTQPEVSVSKIAKKPPKASSAKKTLQKSNKPSLPSNVTTNKAHIEANVATDKTYTNINTSVMESSSDSIDLGAAKNMRHPKKKGIVFPQIDSVVPTSKSLQGDSYTDSTNQEAAKDMHHQPEKQGIVLPEPEPVLSTPKSPQVDSTVNSSRTYSLRKRSSSAPKWKSPQMFQSALKDSAQKWKTFSNEKLTTLTDDPVSHLDKTYESLVDNEDSFENVQVKTKQRFARKASALKLNLSELMKDLRAENRSFAVLEESQTENEAALGRQTNENLREENSSFAALEESQTENEATSERQANEKEITPESLATGKETASKTQLTLVAVTEESIAHDKTTSLGQLSPVREEDNLPERPSAEVEGILIPQTQKSWSDAPVKTHDEGDILSTVHGALDSSEYKLSDPIPPPVKFRDVNDDDKILKSQSASFSISGEDPDNQKMLSTSFSSGSGDDAELDDHISAALISLDSEGENISVPGSSEDSDHVHSLQPPPHTQDKPRSVEKNAISSLKEGPKSVGKVTVSEGEDVPHLIQDPVSGKDVAHAVQENFSVPGSSEDSDHVYSPQPPSRTQDRPKSVEKDTISSLKKSPISVGKDPVSEGEDVPQSPISVGKDPVSEGEGVPQSPISVRKDHVSEGEDVPQSPISVGKDPVSEGEDVPQSPISVGKDPVSEGEDVPQSPISVRKDPVSEGEDVPQSPISVGKDPASEGEDVPQSPISVGKDPVSESEDVPQSPISVGKDPVSEGEDVPQSPISVGKDPASEGEDVPQSPISIGKDPVSEGEDVPQSPISVGKDPVSESEDVPQSPISIRKDPVSEDEDVPQSPISVGKDPASEGEDVPHLIQDPVSDKDVAHVVQEDRLSDEDHNINLLPVTVRKTVQVLQDKSAEDGILVDTKGMSYQVTVEDVKDKASDDDTSSEETSLVVPSLGKQSERDESASKSAADTSVQKSASQPGSSKTKQMTMRDFLQKLTSKPVQPPALADERRPRPWLGDLIGDERSSLAKKTPQQVAPTKKTKQTGKKPLPPSLPKGITREIFSHFAKCKVSSDGMNEIMKTSEKYWKNLSFDLVNFMSARKGSSEIIAKDVRRVMSRQGLISSDLSLFALVEEYLPVEEWNTLIPTAFAKDNIYPTDRAGGGTFK